MERFDCDSETLLSAINVVAIILISLSRATHNGTTCSASGSSDCRDSLKLHQDGTDTLFIIYCRHHHRPRRHRSCLECLMIILYALRYLSFSVKFSFVFRVGAFSHASVLCTHTSNGNVYFPSCKTYHARNMHCCFTFLFYRKKTRWWTKYSINNLCVTSERMHAVAFGMNADVSVLVRLVLIWICFLFLHRRLYSQCSPFLFAYQSLQKKSDKRIFE